MSSQSIPQREKQCISECIFKHWSSTDIKTDPENRDGAYEQCLQDCQVCS